MNKRFSISFIIPVYNDWQRLKLAIESLEQQLSQSNNAVQILVIDNNSSVEMPYTWDFPTAKLLSCEKPGSYSARNIGLKSATGDIITFIDSDCVPKEGFLDSIIQYYSDEENSTTLMAGCVQMVGEKPDRVSIIESYDCIYGLNQKNYVSKGYAVTANLSIPLTVISDIGNFDEQHFSGGDAEICHRAINSGYRLKYNALAVVLHPARGKLIDYKTKLSRIIGAQLARANAKGKLMLLLKTLVFPFYDFFKLFASEAKPYIKIKAILMIPAISFFRIYYYFYHLLPRSSKQR